MSLITSTFLTISAALLRMFFMHKMADRIDPNMDIVRSVNAFKNLGKGKERK